MVGVVCGEVADVETSYGHLKSDRDSATTQGSRARSGGAHKATKHSRITTADRTSSLAYDYTQSTAVPGRHGAQEQKQEQKQKQKRRNSENKNKIRSCQYAQEIHSSLQAAHEPSASMLHDQ
jgi:hypothetical protein